MKERMKCLQDERELRSNHHSFSANRRETRRQQHKPTRDGETTQHKRTTRTTEEGVLSLRHPSLTRVERERVRERRRLTERHPQREGRKGE